MTETKKQSALTEDGKMIRIGTAAIPKSTEDKHTVRNRIGLSGNGNECKKNKRLPACFRGEYLIGGGEKRMHSYKDPTIMKGRVANVWYCGSRLRGGSFSLTSLRV